MSVSADSRPYQPFGAALQLWKCRDSEVLMTGPAGTGKSRACLEKLHAICLRWPGTRALIVRKTRESLTESALVTFESKVLPARSPIAEGPQRRMRQAYHYPNGSEVVVGGLDKPSKVMSTEFDLVYVQEAIELFENDWESLTTRLRNGVSPFQQLIADTNPDGPQHWLNQRCIKHKTTPIESRHEDNPTLWDPKTGDWTENGAKYIAKLDGLTGVRKPRLRYGKWVQAEGAVYDGWDRSVHLIDAFPIPPSWRRIRSIDFGYRNPFVCLWIAIDNDGRMFIYRQLYKTKRTVKVHAAQITKLSEELDRHPPDDNYPNGRPIDYEFTVADHDLEDRATLLENGIATINANKAKTPGIQAVQERLKIEGDGRARLFVFKQCLVERDEDLDDAKLPCSIEEEFDGYMNAKGADGKPIKEDPVKLNDHAMDAVRYATVAIDHKVPAIEPPEVAEAREREAKAAYIKEREDPFHSDYWGDDDD